MARHPSQFQLVTGYIAEQRANRALGGSEDSTANAMLAVIRPVLFDGETAQPALGWHDSHERDRWLLTSRYGRHNHRLSDWPDRPDVSSHLDGGYIATELVMIVLAVILVVVACAVPAVNNILVSTSWKGQTAALAMVVGVIVIFYRVGRIVKRARGEC
jgi:hypothetical protein